MVSAVYRPPLVIVPPCTFQLAATATLSPAWVRPYARNCRDWYGSSVTVSGETTICTTGLLGWLGPVTCTGRSHATASMAAARASDAFISARRLDSLNVNGIALLRKKRSRQPRLTVDSLAARRTSRALLALVP